jgi:hypothetical protein
MTVPGPTSGATSLSSVQKEDRLILEYTTSGAAPASPPEGVLPVCCMLHQDHMQLGHTGTTGQLRSESMGLLDMPSDGLDSTAGTPQPNCSCFRRLASTLSVTTTAQACTGRISRRMDLAAAAGAALLACVCLGPAGAVGGRGPERHSATRSMTTRPPRSGRRVSPEHWTWSCQERVHSVCALVFIALTSLSFFLGKSNP